MKRQDIEKEYKIQGGLIRSPGKFENEPIYAPYFYDILMNGDIGPWQITEEDVIEFPSLKLGHWISLFEDDNGFVYIAHSVIEPEDEDEEDEDEDEDYSKED